MTDEPFELFQPHLDKWNEFLRNKIDWYYIQDSDDIDAAVFDICIYFKTYLETLIRRIQK